MWGKGAGVLLVAVGILSVRNVASIEALRGSLTSNPLLADWGEYMVRSGDTNFLPLQRVTHPISGSLRLNMTRGIVRPSGSDGTDTITPSTALTVLSALVTVPLGLILIIGTMNGEGAIEPRDVPATTTDDTPSQGSVDTRSGTLASASAVDVAAKTRDRGDAGSASDRATYGSLMAVANRDQRQALQREAATLVKQAEQITSRGLDESIVDSLLAGSDSRVATRAREMLTAKAAHAKAEGAAAAAAKVSPGAAAPSTMAEPPPPVSLPEVPGARISGAVPGARISSAVPVGPAGLAAVSSAPQTHTFEL